VLVTGNVHRHPAALANMAATLDVLSGGQLEEASALSQAGLDLGTVVVPPPHRPEVLAPLAEALSKVR
jgi:hypothetical protein